MVGLLLIGLSISIPILCVIFEIIISSDEGFFFIDSDNFNDFSPLINDISFLISFNNE